LLKINVCPYTDSECLEGLATGSSKAPAPPCVREAVSRLQAAADIAYGTGCTLAKMPREQMLDIADLIMKQETTIRQMREELNFIHMAEEDDGR